MNNDEPDYTVQQALQVFYDKHNYGDEGGVNKKYFWLKVYGFSIPLPNLESRRKNVYLHDINHVVMGYDTSWEGESGISAWEIASGGWKDVYVIWLMVLWATGLGMLCYPKSTLKSFRRGLTMANALTCKISKSEMLAMSVIDLRSCLSNRPKSRKSAFTWMTLSSLIFLLPLLNVSLMIWLIFCLF